MFKRLIKEKEKFYGTYRRVVTKKQTRRDRPDVLYGIGRSTARKFVDEAGISYDLKVQDWSDEQVGAIRSKIADMGIKVEGECRSVA